MGNISGAKVGSLDFNSDVIVVGFFLCVVSEIGCVEFSVKKSGKLSCNTVNILTMGKVSCYRNIHNLVVKLEIFLNIHTGKSIFTKHHNAVNFCAVIPVVINAELFTRAEHTVGFNTAKLTLFDCHNVVSTAIVTLFADINGCSGKSGGHVVTNINV